MQSAFDLIHRTRVLTLYKQLYKCVRVCTATPSALKQDTSESGQQIRNVNKFEEILRNEFRQNSVSGSQYCMEKNELFFLANAYLTYLTSNNEALMLYSKYCKGERSIEESANIVGLRLPKQYEPPTD